MEEEDVHPYALLPEDPTTEAIISWIDQRSDDDRHDEQTLEYGTGPDNLEHTAESDGEEFAENSDILRFEVSLDDLESDTEYHAQIVCDSGETVDGISFRTLPDDLSDADDGLNIIVTSDIHIDKEMEDDEAMQDLADQDPDMLLIAGDVVSNGYEESDEIEDYWLDFWDNYMEHINEDFLVPMMMVPGNHEVGNGSGWDGSGSVEPDAGYFQFFFTNTVDLDPTGENYAEVTISDYLQVIGLDTHSAEIDDTAAWLEDNINTDVDMVLPFHHCPILAGGSRSSSDDDLEENLREAWAPIYADAGNVYASFSGHIHVRKRTKRWTVVDEEPDDGDYTELDDGYIVEDENGIVEFGDGMRSNRSVNDDWYLETSDDDEEQFYSLTIEQDLDVVELEVDEHYAYDGDTYNSEIFRTDDDMVDMEDEYSNYGFVRTGRLEVS
ncbi:FN3 domain-containing metallophosphoesterase family protein [Natronorubrum daqingense]|uniref:Purple acid Phosphatase, N-terminal domain n=1 Tax=Natronorubrum daqingense TaxID=588898 RepID=A0A1N7FY15_9EURY|nr:FN3 domain-containing metallophosphoesterase family protein [Natronorubrum daqingense]APX98549.1 hypothetical protein BB347_17745 [Natronorubrum daqingense]SIS05174.1 Purple acid Phosphatase, N-terminal domain [Natronorubrum daqingense]